MYAPNKQTLDSMTPDQALRLLRDGNERFRLERSTRSDLGSQVQGTRDGQWPFAAILSCMDSRTSAELIFDVGLGDVFSVRLAGNCANQDVLGSLEYACKVVGSKLVVVLGHTRCGAIRGACDDVHLGNLTGLLRRIQPALEETRNACPELASDDPALVERVAETNVRLVVDQLREQSPILAELEASGELSVVGAMYDVTSGRVAFLSGVETST